MAGGEQVALSGWKVYFNAFTTTGRRNIVIATYTSLFGTIWLYKRMKRRRALKEAATSTS